MCVWRTITAVLIAVSVALLPMAARTASAAPVQTQASASIDCEHHHAAPVGKTAPVENHCAAMADCVLSCCSITGVVAVSLVPHDGMASALAPARLSQRPHSLDLAPPLRPPRA
jgi:hypothetical protein